VASGTKLRIPALGYVPLVRYCEPNATSRNLSRAMSNNGSDLRFVIRVTRTMQLLTYTETGVASNSCGSLACSGLQRRPSRSPGARSGRETTTRQASPELSIFLTRPHASRAAPMMDGVAQLPASPSSSRVALWRRFRAAGAAGVLNGAWVLPHTPDNLRFFEQSLEMVDRNGGSGLVLPVSEPRRRWTR
jgi:hypothetical protein